MLRRQELKGTRSGALIYDDYAHHPTEVRATLAALRELRPRRLIAVFQPHLYSRTKALAEEFGQALAAADEVGVLDVYAAREEPVGPLEGVSGLQVARAAADHGEGRRVMWLGDRRDGRARPRAAPRRGRSPRHDRCRQRVRARGRSGGGRPHERRAGLSPRQAHHREGGRQRRAVRAASERGGADRVARVGGGARATRSRSSARGRISWLPTLASRDLVLKLDGELTDLERRRHAGSSPGAACRLPSAAAKVARWGLTGLEFGINIPGTVGGAVRMNANAYGGELAAILEWVTVCGPNGAERREPQDLGFEYRRSSLRARRGGLSGLVRPRGGRPGVRQGDPRADAVEAPRRAAVRHQDLRLDVQEPRGPARRGQERRRAPRLGRRARAHRRRRPFLGEACELRRQHGRGDDGGHPGPHGRGPPPRPGALRRRARAGGPGAGRRRVAGKLGAGANA